MCIEVKPVGKPDALVAHVRFDEQGRETESWQAGLRRCLEKDANSQRKPKTTAPIFDSTSISIFDLKSYTLLKINLVSIKTSFNFTIRWREYHG